MSLYKNQPMFTGSFEIQPNQKSDSRFHVLSLIKQKKIFDLFCFSKLIVVKQRKTYLTLVIITFISLLI
jgi:hypothetical protein